jgi:hypothetical protein
MDRVTCRAKCVYNKGGRCGRKVFPGEATVWVDESGRCSNLRPG